jgi:hypothetical protein
LKKGVGGTSFILRIKEQEKRLALHEHDDDDDDDDDDDNDEKGVQAYFKVDLLTGNSPT